MLADELSARLRQQAAFEAAKAAALASGKTKKPDTKSGTEGLNGNEADPSLCGTCHMAHLLCECEPDEEEDEDEDEFEVDQEAWDEALKLIFEGLDSLDRLCEDDRVDLPEGMRFLLMSRRIDVWDFLSEHASPEQIADYQGTGGSEK